MHFLLVVFVILFPNELNTFFADNPDLVMYLEIILWAITLSVIIGISVFIIRRIFDSRSRSVTTKFDWLLFILLFVQVTLGFLVATGYYPGMQWYASSIVPWFISLATLNPDITMWGSFANDGLVKFHAVNGFLIFAVIPYTRLIHFMSFPYGYLFRKYQIAIWYRKRKAYDKN
jgi:nitrate reductase gamma subunit